MRCGPTADPRGGNHAPAGAFHLQSPTRLSDFPLARFFRLSAGREAGSTNEGGGGVSRGLCFGLKPTPPNMSIFHFD
jgi:hypothetical protein